MPVRLLISFFILCTSFLLGQDKNGLVAKFSFNKGNAKDDLGLNEAKAYGISLTEDRFGNSDMAYYFHGNSESYLNLGTSPLLKPEKGTIALWVNIHGLMGLGVGVESNPIIATRSFEGEDCNQAYYLGFDLHTRKLNASITNSCTNAATIYSKKQISFVQWYHVAFTFDNSAMKFYIDGKFQYAVKKDFKTPYLQSDSIIVGNLKEKKNKRYFLGCIDDILIYNRVLNEAEMLELYNEPNPETSKVYIKWIGYILAIGLFVFVIILVIRLRVRKILRLEKEKNQMQNHWYEQENRVLTAQMDPHFIFNSLNTIQQFIIVNENEKAQLYLSKFSRLIRKILDNNTKKNVSLKDEIEVFEKYLEIESLRFNNVFKYEITVAENIEPAKIKIPHFLIQPIIENAIWHGLLPKDGDKQLKISFEIINKETLECTIDDNGVGRKHYKPSEEIEKRKSLAVNFIQQRLQLMSKMIKTVYGLTIIDKVNEAGESIGTKVVLRIPILND